jgi:hypothetical protein
MNDIQSGAEETLSLANGCDLHPLGLDEKSLRGCAIAHWSSDDTCYGETESIAVFELDGRFLVVAEWGDTTGHG